MASDTIDLSGEQTEEEKAFEDMTPAEKRAATKTGGTRRKTNHAAIKDRPSDASKIYTRTDRAERAWQQDIRLRCERTQDRVCEWLEGREDYELATVIREDGGAMIGGMIAMCTTATWLRNPILAGMAVIEPVIAFGRLFAVLFGRFRENRIEAAQERAFAEAEAAAEAQRLADEQARQPQGFATVDEQQAAGRLAFRQRVGGTE